MMRVPPNWQFFSQIREEWLRGKRTIARLRKLAAGYRERAKRARHEERHRVFMLLAERARVAAEAGRFAGAGELLKAAAAMFEEPTP